MTAPLIFLDRDGDLNLQNQLRQKLVDAILAGSLPPGRRLPSSRHLAMQLEVARNTVVLAYQQLIAEGYLVSRERSGVYVNERIVQGRVASGPGLAANDTESGTEWRRRLKGSPPQPRRFRDLPNWKQYPYSFIDGHFDDSLYPVAEWREASRLALGMQEIKEWSTGSGDADDPMLIEEIRTKILPRRGITAQPDEILVTLGAEQALYLATELLVDKTLICGMEEPGNSDMRHLLTRAGAEIVLQPVDDSGLIVDHRLDRCGIVYVTPSHQIPTAVTMPIERREHLIEKAIERDFLIIEDDFECETRYHERPEPALRALDRQNRVIYVAQLSKVFAPGLRLGFLVAAPELIREARELRRLSIRHPPLNNQRAAAYFLALGHYDALMVRLGQTFDERRTALRDALNHYLQQSIAITPVRGGTAYWVRGPDELDVNFLAREAARRGILIEPVEHYFAGSEHPQSSFRMGITGVPVEKIRPAVQSLAMLIHDLISGRQEQLDTAAGNWLKGEELRAALAGATILCRTVYGDPCTIELLEDGRMLGRAGYANEDCDVGRWWVEGDRWNRQWQQWAYGEATSFFTVIEGERIKWFDGTHRQVDSAILRKGSDPMGSDPISSSLQSKRG